MANTKSAQKAQRQAERRAARNRPIRSAVGTYVKKAVAALVASDERAGDAVRVAVKALDKAAKKGIIHRNSAARRKSRLMSRLHSLAVGAKRATTPGEKKASPARKTATGASKKPAEKKAATSRTASSR